MHQEKKKKREKEEEEEKKGSISRQPSAWFWWNSRKSQSWLTLWTEQRSGFTLQLHLKMAGSMQIKLVNKVWLKVTAFLGLFVNFIVKPHQYS